MSRSLCALSTGATLDIMLYGEVELVLSKGSCQVSSKVLFSLEVKSMQAWSQMEMSKFWLYHKPQGI